MYLLKQYSQHTLHISLEQYFISFIAFTQLQFTHNTAKKENDYCTLQCFQLSTMHFVTAITLSDTVDRIFHKDLFSSKIKVQELQDYMYYMVNYKTKDFLL